MIMMARYIIRNSEHHILYNFIKNSSVRESLRILCLLSVTIFLLHMIIQ